MRTNEEEVEGKGTGNAIRDIIRAAGKGLFSLIASGSWRALVVWLITYCRSETCAQEAWQAFDSLDDPCYMRACLLGVAP